MATFDSAFGTTAPLSDGIRRYSSAPGPNTSSFSLGFGDTGGVNLGPSSLYGPAGTFAGTYNGVPIYNNATAGSKGSLTGNFAPSPLPSLRSAYNEFSSVFGPPAPYDPNAAAAQVQGYFGNVPQVTAPTVTPAKIDLPGGTFDQLNKNLYAAQFGPVQQEIERQKTQADTALTGQLAQAGLADSGAGVGQRELQQENFDTYLQNASTNIAANATATALQAEIGVASSNAQLQQQASLANAGFNLTAQTENARNILVGDSAAAQTYLAVLGINAQQAQSYRDSFTKFYGIKADATLQADKFRLDAQSQMLNFYLQQRALDLKNFATEQANNANAYRNASNPGHVSGSTGAANTALASALGRSTPNPSDQPVVSPLGKESALDSQGYGVGVKGSPQNLGTSTGYGPMTDYATSGLPSDGPSPGGAMDALGF